MNIKEGFDQSKAELERREAECGSAFEAVASFLADRGFSHDEGVEVVNEAAVRMGMTHSGPMNILQTGFMMGLNTGLFMTEDPDLEEDQSHG